MCVEQTPTQVVCAFTMLKKIEAKVKDHTVALYGKKMPPSVQEAKNAVLHV